MIGAKNCHGEPQCWPLRVFCPYAIRSCSFVQLNCVTLRFIDCLISVTGRWFVYCFLVHDVWGFCDAVVSSSLNFGIYFAGDGRAGCFTVIIFSLRVDICVCLCSTSMFLPRGYVYWSLICY